MENYKEKLFKTYDILSKKEKTYYFEGGFSEDFPKLDRAIDSDEELTLSMFTRLAGIIKTNIIGKDGKIIVSSKLSNKELTERLLSNPKKIDKTVKVLDTAYKTGFFDDVSPELLPEYLEGLYKNK
ncbi:hypothetical protein [Mammaliicoccus sciuri]|uniref:hypothetical protein n=1 Tax=Mammaliicoccus sciuri TaxID=1296 RepID=UPI00194F000F|nr:hypothetical protein [Mammaliicoccus sciuri]